MKTLTVKQPWASLIVEGIKDVENRTWKTNFRGRVLIHAGTKKVNFYNWYDSQLSNIQLISLHNDLHISDLNYSSIIGSVEIIGCRVNHPSIWAEKTMQFEIKDELSGEVEKGEIIYNWILANPIKFPEPIPAKGKLSFWDYPFILAEPEEENGELFCHCQLPIKDENQIMPMGDGTFRCRYCGGKWYR